MKYNAFISYKHAPLDMEIAKKVHTGLETYKVPKAVRIKTGKKKIERVFRDQEELPIGSNLSDNISDALRESEFLVVICSPRTPESYWVQKEIEAFIGMHGRDHVLAVLVEGEPDESFPKALTVDEEGNPVEPLAADVRGETKKERNTKFKTEILRLIAPILGCTYDDLRQRHKERIIKRTIALVSSAASIIAVAGAAFGIYNANVADKMSKLADEKAALAEEKTELADEILKEFTAKQENQSRFYAKEAMSLLEEGERQDAALVAMAGLPSEDGDRPYVADAEYALGRVLHAYDLGYDMAFDRTLTHNLTVYDEKLSEDMKHLVTKDSGYSVYVWNTETWELLTRIDPGLNERNYLESITEYDVDEDGVYITGDHTFSKYDFEGNCVYTYESEDYLTTSQIVSAGNEAILVTDGRIDIIDLKTGEFIESVDTGDIDLGSKKRLSKGGGYMAFPANDDEVHSSRIVIYNTESKQFVLGNTSEGYIMDTWFTQSGNVAVISCNGDFLGGDVTSVHLDVINAETGKTVASAKVPANVRYSATFDAAVRAHTYQVGDEVHAEVVLAIESEAFTYNELSGELISRVTLPGEMVTLDVRKDNAIGFVGYDNGKIDTFDFYEGRIYSDNTIDTKLPIRDVCIMNGKIAVRAAYTSNVYVHK